MTAYVFLYRDWDFLDFQLFGHFGPFVACDIHPLFKNWDERLRENELAKLFICPIPIRRMTELGLDSVSELEKLAKLYACGP